MRKTIFLFALPCLLSAQTTINGGRTFMGRVDASGASSTLPYRTGTGSPAGRDNCIKAGEAYFQVDAPAGQNFWACTTAGMPGTWILQQAGGGNATQIQGIPVASGTASSVGSFYGYTPAGNFQLFTFGPGLMAAGTSVQLDSATIPNKTTANSYTAGAKQSFTSSATTAGVSLSSTPLPSLAAKGDIAIDTSGNLNWYDGTAWRLGTIADAVLAAGAPLVGNGANHITTGSVSGTGSFVLSSAPTIANPMITSFVNSNHDHSNANNGGQLTVAAFPASNLTGNGTKLATGSGSYTSGDCVKIDANGNLVDNGTTCGAAVGGVNGQTTNYTATSGDNGKLIVMNGNSLTLTLPASPPSPNWMIFVENMNASALVVSRNGLTINGGTSNITLPPYRSTRILTDGANYLADIPIVSGTGITLTSSTNAVTATAAVSSVFGQTGAVPNLSGDVVTSGASIATVAKINGTSIPASGGADQIINTVGSGVGQWTPLPNCQDLNGSHLNYSSASHTFSCGTTASSSGATNNQNVRDIVIAFDGGGDALAGTLTRCRVVDFAGTIQQATIVADQPGSGTFKVLSIAYNSYTGPGSANDISNGGEILSNAATLQDMTLSGWTNSLVSGSVVCGQLIGSNGFTWAEMTLKVAAN